MEINKNVTEDDLSKVLIAIRDLETIIKEEIKNIFEIESNLYGLTKKLHYFFSIANRAIGLNRGYCLLANANNYISAIPLIRLQVDNCLRLFAISLVENSSVFYDEVLKGTQIKNLQDSDGKKMNDKYLVDKIMLYFPEFGPLYKNTSGFIHFSNEHLFINNKVKDEPENSFTMRTTVGAIDDLEIYNKVDYCYNMFMAGKNLYKMIYSYRYDLEKMLEEDGIKTYT